MSLMVCYAEQADTDRLPCTRVHWMSPNKALCKLLVCQIKQEWSTEFMQFNLSGSSVSKALFTHAYWATIFFQLFLHSPLRSLFTCVLPNLKACSLSPVIQPSSAWPYIAQPISTFLPSQPECWLSLSFYLMRSSQHEPSCPCLAPGEVWAPYSHSFLKWCTSFWGLSGKDYISVHNKFDHKT